MANGNGRSNRSKNKAREERRVTDGAQTPLHRLAQIRRRKEVSRQVVARHLGATLADVKSQERETADIPLSVLYKWQKALGVPLAELLVDRGTELAPPVANRAQMVRVMRTALSILNQSRQAGVRWLARALVDQLLEIMPELREVKPRRNARQRRNSPDFGQAAVPAPSKNLLQRD